MTTLSDAGLNTLTDEELFEVVMKAVADKMEFNMEFLYEGWKVVFTKEETNERYELLHYDFGLNSGQASFITKDKAMCYDYLKRAGVPSIEHFLLKPPGYKYLDTDAKAMLEFVKTHYDFPIVAKQNNGGGGKNIHFAFDDSDLTLAISSLSASNVQVSLSPYYDFNIEYRCTVLDNEMLMSYGKTKGDNLQNNLSKGAQVVDVPESIKEELNSLSVNAAKALGLCFANIDIVETKEGLKVLEANNTVALKRVNRNSVDRLRQSINVYEKALIKLRGDKHDRQNG